MPPLRQSLEKRPLTQFLDACGIVVMFFGPIDTQQMSHVLRHVLLSDSGKVGKTVKFPKTTVSLNYLFNQITHTLRLFCDLLLKANIIFFHFH